MSDLRYPIGPLQLPQHFDDQMRKHFIKDIEQLPAKLRNAVARLSDSQLDTPYRPEGWTVRQLVHHLADSHMNAYVRTRLALTEDAPTVKVYDEKLWARLPDASAAQIELSLDLLDPLHKRWTILLRSMKAEDWARTMRHPERGLHDLNVGAAIYSWHGRHHVAHVTSLRKRMGW